MAEDQAQQQEGQGEPHGEPDYRQLYEAEKAAREKAEAESRRWEKRSKENLDKARKYDAAAGDGGSLEERIASLEADKARLEGEKARAALVSKVAESSGLPEHIVAALSGGDEEALSKQAEAISALKPAGAPSAPEAGRFPHGEQTKKTTAQLFAEAVNQS